MSESSAPVHVSPTSSLAGLLWPGMAGRSGLARAALLAIGGACLLTISAKIKVPGPVPMTLQTLAVMALGAALGMRLAVASVAIYVAQGLAGLPVFANTPPMAPGLAYLLGPTGGFLVGFAVAAAMVGHAADRGLVRKPFAFALVLAAANVALLAIGALWIALLAQTAAGTGLGFAKALAIGVQPFMLGNAIKLAIAALAFPLIYDALLRIARR